MKKILIFIVTYNAEKTIESVLTRIPSELFESSEFQTEILIIDDASEDSTVERSKFFQQSFRKAALHIFKNKNNLGYGGNQKLGYRYAIDHGFDVVALLHGDGQYAPEELPRLLRPLVEGEMVVFGSRMLVPGAALKGGMPFYKYLGNKLLTFIENKIAQTELSEYHSGYRLYSTAALKKIPFEQNADGFDFDTDIILQLHLVGIRPKELAVPTFYGDEICYVNIVGYSIKIIFSCIISRLQKLGLAYHPKFDIDSEYSPYKPKFNFDSSHSAALHQVQNDSSLLILGAGSYDLIQPFAEKNCSITAVDQKLDQQTRQLFPSSIETDLDNFDLSNLPNNSYDYVLLLDLIEHLRSADQFLENLNRNKNLSEANFIITTANIAFIAMRLSLLFGVFNYTKKGILDRTHFRLFTFASLAGLLKQSGYDIVKVRGIPAPFPLVFGDNIFSKSMIYLNRLAICFSKRIFSYQMLFLVKPRITPAILLKRAESSS